MSSDLKLAFAGTPELAASILGSLISADLYKIAGVYTQPDRPAGRGRKMQKSAVKQVAEINHLPLHQPESSADIDHDNLLSNADVLIVAAYGMLLPKSILDRPRLGCINVHTSLLPRWRGAAPIQRAIQAGDQLTGITIMQMDAGLDTGDILLQETCTITERETAGTLHDTLSLLGSKALLEVLVQLDKGKLKARPQDNSLANYANKITKAEANIDWNTSAEIIERNVRAFNPFPVAYTTLHGFKMRIWEVEILENCNDRQKPGTVVNSSTSGIDVASRDQLIRIHKLQLAGKKIVSASDFINGHQNFAVPG